MSKRFRHLIFIIVIIAFGLLSRKLPGVPAWIGDALYATMMFYIIRLFFINKSTGWVAFVSLCICFIIECSQIYQADWINTIRRTLPGRLILGQGFLWIDLIAYTVGILLAVLVAKLAKPEVPKI